MKTQTPTFKPDGLKDLEELYKDFLSISVNGNSPFGTQILNNLILKLDIIIRKIKHKPRLPLYQIEKEIIKICMKDNSSHGVLVEFTFTSKFGNIDPSRLSHLKVNI